MPTPPRQIDSPGSAVAADAQGRQVPAVTTMLTAGSIALVGASARPGSFGARMLVEVTRSRNTRRVHLVNPRRQQIGSQQCVASIGALEEPIDLALIAVGDVALDDALADAAGHGVRSAVVFGGAHRPGQRERIRRIAADAGMALCGAGCMGFVNVAHDLRALGYVERPDLPRGPIALITHSGSVFSALLRTHRALGYDLAVSSGQELVTTTADYLGHVLDHTDTSVIALVLETVRDHERLLANLARAAARDVPVVLLPVGASPVGAALVAAHSGALAGARAMWEALAEATGALVVSDLGELTDTLELLTLTRRAGPGSGVATVHDSGAERTMVADLADSLAVPFAALSQQTMRALGGLLDEGLVPANPLDLWGTGADTRRLFADALRIVAADAQVQVVALAVDLVEEYDGDTAYPDAVLDLAADTPTPLVVLANLPAAIDQVAARRLRAAGVPVLEGSRSGLIAMRHLLALADRHPPEPSATMIDTRRQARWTARLADPAPLNSLEGFALLTDYGIATVRAGAAQSSEQAVAIADAIGYPVVLKTDEPIAHKSDVGGVVLDVGDAAACARAYAALAATLGPRVVVSATAPAGVEVAVGLTLDATLGPLVVVAAGGTLAELLDDRAVALPPLSRERAAGLLARIRITRMLDGWRGGGPLDRESVLEAIVGIGALAHELGHSLIAVDVNPLIVSTLGAPAVDVLVQARI